MTKHFKEVIEQISNSLDSMDEEIYNKLVMDCKSVIDNGGKIIASGLGKNVPICEKFVGTLLSLGINAMFLNTNSATHGDIGAVHDGDLVIILTKSGETGESVYLTKLLQKRKAKLWLLSFEQKSTLTNMIEDCLILKLEHEGDLWNIMPNNSTTINLMVLQSVAMDLAREEELTLDDFKRNHPGGHIGELLNNTKFDFIRRTV